MNSSVELVFITACATAIPSLVSNLIYHHFTYKLKVKHDVRVSKEQALDNFNKSAIEFNNSTKNNEKLRMNYEKAINKLLIYFSDVKVPFLEILNNLRSNDNNLDGYYETLRKTVKFLSKRL